jgi:hypothetical protein
VTAKVATGTYALGVHRQGSTPLDQRCEPRYVFKLFSDSAPTARHRTSDEGAGKMGECRVPAAGQSLDQTGAERIRIGRAARSWLLGGHMQMFAQYACKGARGLTAHELAHESQGAQ